MHHIGEQDGYLLVLRPGIGFLDWRTTAVTESSALTRLAATCAARCNGRHPTLRQSEPHRFQGALRIGGQKPHEQPFALTVIPTQSFETLICRLFRDRGRKINPGLALIWGRRCFLSVIETPTGRAAASQRCRDARGGGAGHSTL